MWGIPGGGRLSKAQVQCQVSACICCTFGHKLPLHRVGCHLGSQEPACMHLSDACVSSNPVKEVPYRVGSRFSCTFCYLYSPWTWCPTSLEHIEEKSMSCQVRGWVCVCTYMRKHVDRNCYLEGIVVSTGNGECLACLSLDAVQGIVRWGPQKPWKCLYLRSGTQKSWN